MTASNLRANRQRLLGRIEALGEIGATPEGGVRRLALTDEDKAGRDLLLDWLRQAGLTPQIDAIGNIFAVRPGREDLRR